MPAASRHEFGSEYWRIPYREGWCRSIRSRLMFFVVLRLCIETNQMMSQNNFAELASTAFQNQKAASVVIADTIRRAILRGQFSPGQAMPQEEIAKQFKVSRAPVRDALRQLEPAAE